VKTKVRKCLIAKAKIKRWLVRPTRKDAYFFKGSRQRYAEQLELTSSSEELKKKYESMRVYRDSQEEGCELC